MGVEDLDQVRDGSEPSHPTSSFAGHLNDQFANAVVIYLLFGDRLYNPILAVLPQIDERWPLEKRRVKPYPTLALIDHLQVLFFLMNCLLFLNT